MKKEWKNPNFSVLGIEWTKDFPSVRMPSGTNLPGTVKCTYPGCNQSKYVRNEDEYNEFVNNHSTIHVSYTHLDVYKRQYYHRTIE